MITCDECKGWPIVHFVEMVGEQKRRTLCPICAAYVASRYVARAKRRTEWQRRRPLRQEATQ